jgi:hypothetical protein
VVVVAPGIEPGRQVALGADQVARGAQLQAVGIVAVGAGDALLEHPALQERAVFVVLLQDLPVGKIEASLEQIRHGAVEQRMAISEARRDLASARVAEAAGFALVVG